MEWNDSGKDFECGRRVLLSPRSKPNLKKYGKFSDNINLADSSTYLGGPFDFKKKDSSTPAHSVIDEKHWITLAAACEEKMFVSPTIGNRRRKKDIADINNLRQLLPLHNNISEAMQSSSFMRLVCFFSKRGEKGEIEFPDKYDSRFCTYTYRDTGMRRTVIITFS